MIATTSHIHPTAGAARMMPGFAASNGPDKTGPVAGVAPSGRTGRFVRPATSFVPARRSEDPAATMASAASHTSRRVRPGATEIVLAFNPDDDRRKTPATLDQNFALVSGDELYRAAENLAGDYASRGFLFDIDI